MKSIRTVTASEAKKADLLNKVHWIIDGSFRNSDGYILPPYVDNSNRLINIVQKGCLLDNQDYFWLMRCMVATLTEYNDDSYRDTVDTVAAFARWYSM